MKKLLLILFFGITLSFAGVFDDGLKAYQNQDYKKAVELYTLAADQGVAEAQFNLGNMYRRGDGVRQDYKKAKEFFGKACDNGLQLGCDDYKDLNQKGY